MSNMSLARRTRWTPVFLAVSAIVSASASAQQQTAASAAALDDLQEVVITAIIDASKRAADEQRNARGVTNVVASDSIGRFQTPISPRLCSASSAWRFRAIRVRGGTSMCVEVRPSSRR